MSVFYYHTNDPMPAEARSQRDPSCRLCNKTSSTKKRILYREWRDERVNSKIESLLGIRLHYHQHLSNTICEECYEKLASFDTFVKCVLANQVLFSQNLSDKVFEVIPITRIKSEKDGPKGRGKPKPKSVFSRIKEAALMSREEGGSKPIIINTEAKRIEINNKKSGWTETIFLPSAETSRPVANIGSMSIKLEPAEPDPVIYEEEEDEVCIDECDRRRNNLRSKIPSLEITSVQSCSTEVIPAFSSKRQNEKSQTSESEVSDSDCIVLDDEQPSKKRKPSTPPKIRVSSNIYATPPPAKMSENALTSNDKVEIFVKEEPLGFDGNGAEINPIPIKQETAPKEPEPAKPKITYKVTQRDSNCLPCYRCNKKNESYLNLLYHHINNCSPEVPESDPDPPLVLEAEDFKRQCEEIETDEALLLRQIYREINECLKNTQTLRNYYSRMIDLTKPVLMKYCQEQGISLNVPVCTAKPPRKKSSKVGYRKK